MQVEDVPASNNGSQTPVVMKPAVAPVPDDLERCEKCSAPVEGFAVCRACGYYAKLGEFVEIDHEMEGFELEKEEEPFRLPKWSFAMIASSVAIIAEAGSLALLLPINTIERLVVSALHMVIGFALVLVMQCRSTFLAMMDDPEVSMLDCIAFPPKAWAAVFRRLPETKAIATTFTCGATAMFCSLVILRAVPYGAIFGGEPYNPDDVRSVIVDKMLEQAHEAEEDANQDLQSAIDEFANQAGQNAQGDEEPLDEGTEDELTSAIKSARCIVIGFNAAEGDVPRVQSIIVATKNRNPISNAKWEVLGSVAVSDEAQGQYLFAQLSQKITQKPFVESKYSANWVKPSVKCEVSFEEKDDEEHTPENVKLTKLW